MTESPTAPEGSAARWTSPFCLLLCDTLAVRPDAAGTGLELAEGECAGARAALSSFGAVPSGAPALVHGRGSTPAEAIEAAARVLGASRQPLFGGLGTDVAGARALYHLARETGALCDAANGAGHMQAVRAVQDRGGYGTTLAEVRNRADLVVCLDGLPSGGAAEFLARCGVGAADSPQRHLVLLGGSAAEQARVASLNGQPNLTAASLALAGDLFSTVALLSALVAGRVREGADPGLSGLAARLRGARYSVIVGETDRLPAHGALVIETVGRIVAALNADTRASAMWLGGGNGAGTVNEVFTWLSGLPLRSRWSPAGLEHDPVCFDAARLLADAAVDSLLWISSFDAACLPPDTGLPLIVLGHPALASSAQREGAVFIPVSTPGIGSTGHLFRADGGAVLPLVPVYRDTLPTAAAVLGELTQRVQALRERARPA